MTKFLHKFLAPAIMCVFALALHLFRLTHFPVFADEAIYIRWAQLILDDWQRYMFFPLSDGKTPLFIWLIAFTQRFFADQLFAARFLAVVVGAVHILVGRLVLAKLGAKQHFQVFGMLLLIILPFFYFQAHVALMDGLLSVFLSLGLLGTLYQLQSVVKHQRLQPLHILLTGVTLGAATWTKLPALFFLPTLFFFAFLPAKLSFQQRARFCLGIAISILIAAVLFFLLRISPIFGTLLHRGNDYTYTFSEVLLHGMWQKTLPNLPSYLWYFLQYLTPGILLLSLTGLFSTKNRRLTLILLATALFFCAPFVVFGKVIYARYFFPACFAIVIAAVLNTQQLYEHWIVHIDRRRIVATLSIALSLVVIISSSVTHSSQFIQSILFTPEKTPFVSSDRHQYLESWSSGQGIWETSQYIKHQAKTHSIAVATEGRFGTLPDGLLLYFHQQNVDGVYIEGIGQYPVKYLPDFFLSRAKNYDQTLLVVNSDRMELKLPNDQLLGQYCRPHAAPCLQIWDVTTQVKE